MSVLSAPTQKSGQPEQSRYPVLGRSITVGSVGMVVTFGILRYRIRSNPTDFAQYMICLSMSQGILYPVSRKQLFGRSRYHICIPLDPFVVIDLLCQVSGENVSDSSKVSQLRGLLTS